ncbi:LamG domain-containing protein, partial [Candidatus Parcubacteria bacterium]
MSFSFRLTTPVLARGAILATLLFAFFLGSSESAYAQVLQLPRAGGSYVDPATAKTVYRLTDRTMCPAGAEHVYSDTFEHSRFGTLVQCRYDVTNLNLYRWVLVGPDHSTILFNDIAVASNAPSQSYNFNEMQWIPNQQRILGMQRSTSRVYEFNPWNGITTTYAQMPAGCVFDWRLNPQGQVIARTNDKNTMCIFDPVTGTAATKNMAIVSPSPDQTSALFNGRGLFTWNVNPQRAYFPGFTGEIVFDDFHGHLGQFRDQNGQWYTVNTKEDRLPSGGVGQVGCPNVSPWRPEQAIYNADTGQRVLIWGCDLPITDPDHWTTAAAVNRFGSSGHQEIAVYDVNWTTGTVTRTLVAKVHRDPGTGYEGSPRATADYDLNEILFHSGMCDGQVLEYDGTVKSCAGFQGVAKNLDLYVVQVGGSTPPPPPPTPDTQPPTVSLTAPAGGASVSGAIAVSANASDNVGIAGVQFLLNGANLGFEDTVAPYSVSWDTTTVANGAFILSARARDFTGNQTTSGSVTVTASNVVIPSPAVGTLLLYTTLDSANAITAPMTGTGAGASLTGAPAFVTGQIGQAVNIDASQKYARLQQIAGTTQNVELTRGTIEFWYKPLSPHTDGVMRQIVSTGLWGTPGTVSLLKRGGTNNELSAFIFPVGGGFREVNIPSTSYSWNANQWVKLRVTWDAAASQLLRVYVNDVEKTGTGSNAGPITVPAESASNYIYIGTRDPAETNHANGAIDELRIWSGAIPPGTTPPPPPPSTKFSLGDAVQATQNLNVRSIAS